MTFENPNHPEELPTELIGEALPYGADLLHNLPPGTRDELSCVLDPESGANDDVIFPDMFAVSHGTFAEMPDFGSSSDTK